MAGNVPGAGRRQLEPAWADLEFQICPSHFLRNGISCSKGSPPTSPKPHRDLQPKKREFPSPRIPGRRLLLMPVARAELIPKIQDGDGTGRKCRKSWIRAWLRNREFWNVWGGIPKSAGGGAPKSKDTTPAPGTNPGEDSEQGSGQEEKRSGIPEGRGQKIPEGMG